MFADILGKWKAFSKVVFWVKVDWWREIINERFECVWLFVDIFSDIKEDTSFVAIFKSEKVFYSDCHILSILRNHCDVDCFRSSKHLRYCKGQKEAVSICFWLKKIRRAPRSNRSSFRRPKFRYKKWLRSIAFQSWCSWVLGILLSLKLSKQTHLDLIKSTQRNVTKVRYCGEYRVNSTILCVKDRNVLFVVKKKVIIGFWSDALRKNHLMIALKFREPFKLDDEIRILSGFRLNKPRAFRYIRSEDGWDENEVLPAHFLWLGGKCQRN